MALDRPRIEIYQSESNTQKWRWRFRAKNGEIVAQGEGYTTVAGLMNGLNCIGQAVLSGDYEVIEVDSYGNDLTQSC